MSVLDDVWGKVSAGVNFFNPVSQHKRLRQARRYFGDDIDGTGGKAGMRVSW